MMMLGAMNMLIKSFAKCPQHTLRFRGIDLHSRASISITDSLYGPKQALRSETDVAHHLFNTLKEPST